MGLIKTVTNVLALIVFGVVVPNAVAQNHYFVSSSSGDDNHDGFSVDAAWASLERVNSAVLKPGDSVQFKSGDTFFGQLVIDESGSVEKPLSFTSFGPGEPPVIDGATRNDGDNVSAISIIDQDHIEISHLTIRNFRKQARQSAHPQSAVDSSSTSFTVRAPNAKKVQLHSSGLNWKPNHPKGRAFDNGDGSWSVIIEPSWKKVARYKWIIDGEKENIDDDVSRGHCKARLAAGTIMSGKNGARREWAPGDGNVRNDVADNCKRAGDKKIKTDPTDFKAYGILVKNTGRRVLQGFEFHHLTVEKVYPIRAKSKFKEKAFVGNTVTGIRFETLAAKSLKKAANTRDIFVHDNLIRQTGRFGIAARHGPSRISGLTGTSLDYDVNFIVRNNRCEDLGGSCVLMSGVWQGLLEGNTFIRSGAMVEPSVSVSRGSGAWFFRSKHVVAQNNVAAFSRGHNDSAGIHVDYNNENILVQYNFTYDNEGYGTEILGKNKNIIWRYNISVGDGTRKINVNRPEGGKSQNPGKTLHVSDFAKPEREPSTGVYIYNNTYLISAESEPNIELTAKNLKLWNNLFIVQESGELGKRVYVGVPKKSINIQGNGFSGDVSSKFVKLDSLPNMLELSATGVLSTPESFAFEREKVKASSGIVKNQHPTFPAAGTGIFSHISEIPAEDFFGNLLDEDSQFIGAGIK